MQPWSEGPEGELAVDVYTTERELVVQAAIAGVEKKDLDLSVEGDTFTIRGTRKLREAVPSSSYLWRECFWGNFSRSIVLPFPVKTEHIKAELEKGVLTIYLPKQDS